MLKTKQDILTLSEINAFLNQYGMYIEDEELIRIDGTCEDLFFWEIGTINTREKLKAFLDEKSRSFNVRTRIDSHIGSNISKYNSEQIQEITNEVQEAYNKLCYLSVYFDEKFDKWKKSSSYNPSCNAKDVSQSNFINKNFCHDKEGR